MSTMRYSGSVSIRITYIDARQSDVYRDGIPRNPNGQYRCFLRADSGANTTIHVGAPAVLAHAVDCPEAFDEAAHAAISFAVGDDIDGIAIHISPTLDGSGWHIGRSPEKAYPYSDEKTSTAV